VTVVDSSQELDVQQHRLSRRLFTTPLRPRLPASSAPSPFIGCPSRVVRHILRRTSALRDARSAAHAIQELAGQGDRHDAVFMHLSPSVVDVRFGRSISRVRLRRTLLRGTSLQRFGDRGRRGRVSEDQWI